MARAERKRDASYGRCHAVDDMSRTGVEFRDGRFADVQSVYKALTGTEKDFLTPGRTVYKDSPVLSRTVAYDGDRPVGFADWYPSRKKSRAHLCVAVSNGARGKGLAGKMAIDSLKKLVRQLAEEKARARREGGAELDKWCSQARIRRFVWGLDAKNNASARAAEKAGFREQEFKRPHRFRRFVMSRGEAERMLPKYIGFPEEKKAEADIPTIYDEVRKAYAGGGLTAVSLPHEKKAAGMDKCAASKLRALLNAGKLSAGQVSKLRGLGMLPSKRQYVEGARNMLKQRIERIFAHAGARGIPLTVRTGVPRGKSSHSYSYDIDNMNKTIVRTGPADGVGTVNTMWGRPLDPRTAEHTINLPGAVDITQSSAVPSRIGVDATKARLHDIIVGNHELDEYLGWWRNGGHNAWHNPMAILADLSTHIPGVLRRERKLYDRLCRQLGISRPKWSNFRTGGMTGSRPRRRSDLRSEQVLSTFSDRDHRALLRLLRDVPATREEMAVAQGAVYDNLFGHMWDAAHSYTGRAADLAGRRGLKKLERYLRSEPVAYYLPGRERSIAGPNYRHVQRQQEYYAPEVSSVPAKELLNFYRGKS